MTPPRRRGRSRPGQRAAPVIEAVGEADAEASPSFVLSCVDAPRPGARLQPGGMLTGKGWAISGAPIASIAVHLGEMFLCYAHYGQSRPEIGRDYPDYPQSHHSGFGFSVQLGPQIEAVRGADLEFRFRTETGGESRRHVALTWPSAESAANEDAARQWPIRLALEECRIDGAGRLRLRGWAVARGELNALQLFLNDAPLHPPERGLDRPDIAGRHPAYPDAGRSGFRLVQVLDAPAGPLDTVRVVARAGKLQRQIIVPLAPPGDQRRLLQAGAVNLCCETLRVASDGMLAIAGWAVGAAETRQIEVLDGAAEGGSLGLADIGLPRPDIGNRFPNLPAARFAGFRFRQHLPPGAADSVALVVRDADGGERRLRLRLPAHAGAGVEPGAAGADDEIIHRGIDAPVLLNGRAEAPIRGGVNIAGWAVCGSGIETVEVWSDDARLGTAFVGVRREDIGAAFPDLADALSSGFALTVPHGLIGDGEHTLRVLIRARSGAATEEVFRIVLEAGDDSRLGAIRRTVPFSETALRLALLERFGPLPELVVVVRQGGGGDGRALAATLESLRRQSLTRWRALVLVREEPEAAAAIAAESGCGGRVEVRLAGDEPLLWSEPAAGFELLGLLRAGDRLGADALMELALEARLSGAAFVYADERCFDPSRASVRPFFKPDWSPDLLLSMNYIGRAWCATRTLAERAGIGARSIDRMGDYDAVLRLTEAAGRVAHVPLSLCERAGRRGESPRREQEALSRAAERRRIGGQVLAGRAPGTWRLQRRLPDAGLVSVIVPTCGARGLVRAAVRTLRAQSGGWPVELIVLDDVPAGQTELKAWLRAEADRVIETAGPFNWSRANNAAARAARGDYLLFLNDDTECTDPHWLGAMLEHAQRPEVGAVGAQLRYPDGKVQHAGMFLRGGEGLHAFRFADADDPGPFGLALSQREVTAVTGACLMVRSAVFAQLGGFDETHDVIKNDLDFCLRLGQAGLRVVYTPYASLVHHEMASRAALADSFDASRFTGAWGLAQLRGDRLINPNLAATSEDMAADPEPVQIVQAAHPLIERAEIRRILIVKLDHIGDFVCALPAIERLAAAFAGARITLLAAPASIALAGLSPSIHETIPFGFFEASPHAGRRAIAEGELEALSARLHAMRFDLAVDLRTHPDTRHVLRYAGAAVCAGFDHGGRFPWLDVAVEWEGDLRLVDKRAHVTDSLLRLAGAVDEAARGPDGGRELPAVPASAAVRRLLDAAGAPAGFGSRPLVCIHPGAGTALKQWPAASFAGLIRLLLADREVSVVLIGGPGEAALAEEVAALAGRPDAVLCLAGRIDLAGLPGLLSGCALFVGNDSGPKHLAGVLGVPTVGVHASHVDAREWGPLGPRAVAIRRHMTCGPCYIAEEADCPRGVACLRGISPAQVYRACRLLLGFAFGAPEESSGASIKGDGAAGGEGAAGA